MFYTADKCKKRECGKKIYKAKHCWTLRLGLFVKLCCCRLDFLHEIKLLIMSGNARKLQKATTISPRFFEMWLDAACSRETLTLAITLSFVFEVGLKCKSCFIIWLIEVMLHVCILWKNTQNTHKTQKMRELLLNKYKYILFVFAPCYTLTPIDVTLFTFDHLSIKIRILLNRSVNGDTWAITTFVVLFCCLFFSHKHYNLQL